MSSRLLLLPGKSTESSRLIKVPADYESHEAFRHVTGIIAAIEEQGGSVDDVMEALEVKGFEVIEFAVGPSLP